MLLPLLRDCWSAIFLAHGSSVHLRGPFVIAGSVDGKRGGVAGYDGVCAAQVGEEVVDPGVGTQVPLRVS
jgi:hypothetical protein